MIERLETPRGELVLRQRGEHYEIISNGVFLMATYNGDSERRLAETALAAVTKAPPRRVLVAGLGVGFTLAAALAWPGVQHVTVVEIEEAVVAWQRTHLAPWSHHALEDPRVELVVADFVTWLSGEPAEGRAFDVALIDIDNGPNWTVTTANARLYDDAGLAALRRRLRPGGACAFWAAAEDRQFHARLRRLIGEVNAHRVPRARGGPDMIYVAVRA